ncbi:hypothetical protein Tco_1033817, partial [Tanacetum coccineum]
PFSPNASIVGQSQFPSQPTGLTTAPPAQPALSPTTSPQQFSTSGNLGQATIWPHAFTVSTLLDPLTGFCHMDTGASSHIHNSITTLSENLNLFMYTSISVGDGHSIPITNTGHSILPTSTRSLRLNNVLITPHIVKKLISVRQFVCDNNCTIEFEQLCATYEVDNYIRSPSTENSTSASTPLTPEELKVDKIVLSWIFTTLFDPLQARLVVARPKIGKEAWGILFDIVKDNNKSRTNALKAELHSIKLGDRSMESYFQKVDSIVNILTSLDARGNEEDVIHYVFDGLPKTYNQVCGYMHYRD